MNAEQRELWRKLTVLLVLEIRAEYLAAHPRSQLTHWDQIKDRIMASARTSGSVSEWITSLCRRLSLPASGKRLSSTIRDLAGAVEPHDGDFLAWIEAEHTLVLALARGEAEQRKLRRDEWVRQKGIDLGFIQDPDEEGL